jgi:Peptidase family M1 domain/Omp85 superfamily domain
MGLAKLTLWTALSLACLQAVAGVGRAAEIPPWLPRYHLDIQLDVGGAKARVRQFVTWHNRHQRPATDLVFNAHSHYSIRPDEIGFGAKTLEILRMAPHEGLDLEGPALQVERVLLGPKELAFSYLEENPTALRVELGQTVNQGDSIVVELDYSIRLPAKQGRWGQWQGVTFLTNWVPVLAVYDEKGWQHVPFIPWHQPFFNEAGFYSAKLRVAEDQKIACSLPITQERPTVEGMKEVEFAPQYLRDFALLTCARYRVVEARAGDVTIRCLALPEHLFYAEKMVQWAAEALPVYERWIGPYPYKHFTIAESFFGWTGNECGALIMIDNRVFDMPHAATPYVEGLVSHEFCHQWFYNTIGTNGFAETWMDEGVVTYLSNRLLDRKRGHNNLLLEFPAGLTWMPNIHRDTFNNYSYRGAYARGEALPTVQEMPKYGHLVNLLSTCYDRGSHVVGMIEERMGEEAFFDFWHVIYSRYYFRILRVADLQRELEAYTGRSWKKFFDDWLYGAGVTDWAVERVLLQPTADALGRGSSEASFLVDFLGRKKKAKQACRAVVLLHQKAQINEPTVLGICLDGTDNYQIRIPIEPGLRSLDLEDPPAHVENLGDNRIRVVIELPSKPTQITVDPDQVLMDVNPVNNSWKTRCHTRFTPFYTPLEETDVTNEYDQWNFIYGPGFFGSAYNDPWYTRSTVFGGRAGFYRTQEASGGAYVGYRTDNRDIVAGVDALIDHFPFSHMQLGFNAERSLTPIDGDDMASSRGVLFARYIFMYGSSLYLPPAHYVEAYAAMENHALPTPYQFIPGTDHFNQQSMLGVHYHLDYLTPYWDPEGGFRLDTNFAAGVPIFGEQRSFQRVDAQFSTIKSLPSWTGPLSDTRLAMRIYGAAALPNNGELYTLGGSTLFRGYDLRQRQGNMVWVGSLEWRIPVIRGATWDYCDHVASVKNIYMAAFYDVGDAYVKEHSIGPVAHALGLGLRVDVAWFSLIERTTLRVDAAQTLDGSAPTQFWFGIQQPF